LVDLAEKANIKMEDYSGGMQRRLEIARGLMHYPHVLFLDEPTLGLDAQTRRYIWQYIRNMNKEKGVTIILTTHYMEEADALCGRVAIIDNGKIVALLDTPSNLKDMIGSDTVSLEVQSGAEALMSCLRSFPWIKPSIIVNETLDLTLNDDDQSTSYRLTFLPTQPETDQNGQPAEIPGGNPWPW
jgi:ABC-2 type transport system ATP-binding protein